MSDLIIQAAGLCKNYGKKAAINSFTVDIPAGGLIGLIGRNGSGKTTLMKLCAGQLEVSGGKLEVMGSAPMDNLDVLSNLVYTFHDMPYEKQLKLQTILSNYAVMFRDFDLEFAGKLLKYFNLSAKTKYKQLSLGMASIFNFICGLACRAQLTMFDEPVLGMDITVRKAAYEVLLRDYSIHPRTIIISSHLLGEMENILSDILLIDEGRPVLFENIDDLRQGAYRIEGKKSAVDSFAAGKQVVYYQGGINCEAVIKEKVGDTIQEQAQRSGLRVSPVRPEDLCVYLTRENKEGELSCLWKKTN